MKATVMLIRHGRDAFFPWPWGDLVIGGGGSLHGRGGGFIPGAGPEYSRGMAVERSYHGRGEVLIP